MESIDQTSIIEQLAAENAVLRDALRDSPVRELQIAGAIATLVNELTRLGPRATARTLTWALGRYMKSSSTFYEHQFIDRRPKQETTPVVDPQPAETPTTQKARGDELRKRRSATGVTQNKLARRVGLHQTDISQIERGKIQVSDDTWQAIWNALELP